MNGSGNWSVIAAAMSFKSTRNGTDRVMLTQAATIYSMDAAAAITRSRGWILSWIGLA